MRRRGPIVSGPSCAVLMLALLPVGGNACTSRAPVSGAGRATVSDPALEAVPRRMERAAPGPELQRLAPLIGDWQAECEIWSSADSTAQKSQGTMSNFWLLEGNFVGQEYKSRGLNPPFQGLGALGYHAVDKVYTSVWLESTSTSTFTAQGKWDRSGHVLNFDGWHEDPAAGQRVQSKSKIRLIGKKKYAYELFKPGADGAMFRALRITFTRK